MDARRRLTLPALALALSLTAGPAFAASPPAGPSGAAGVARAARAALEPSPLDRFERGQLRLQFLPGRLYEVWTTPLRVTTLSLSPGESVIDIAAGDTVRWQIAQARSGQGSEVSTHVLIKPFERGLATNLVITTDQRLYLVLLRSGEAFHTQVSWTPPAQPPAPSPPPSPPPAQLAILPIAYSIAPRGRAPTWTPSAVMTDGARTYIVFPANLPSAEAPALTLIGDDGKPVLANYRQQGGLFTVDGVIDLAELRLGKAQVVRIARQREGSR